MSCCDFGSNGASAPPSGPVPPADFAESFIYYEVDFAAQPTNAFTDGVETIDGLGYTVVQTALAGAAWGVVNGQGIQIANPAAARTWTLASPTTAPYFYLRQSDIPDYDPEYPLIVDLHLTGQAYPNGNDALRVGQWQIAASPYAASTARARIMERGNFGGTSTIRVFDGTIVTTSPETFAPDLISMRFDPSGVMQTAYGTWAGDFVSSMPLLSSLSFTTANTNLNPLNDPLARLTFIAINSAAGMAVTIRNMRLRRG